MATASESTQHHSCPVCSGPIKGWRSKRAGDQTYHMDVCQSCGFAFVNPRPSLDFLMDFYSSFGHGNSDRAEVALDAEAVQAREKKEPNSTLDAKRLIKTIKSLSAKGSNHRFLDVGCGYGFFSKEAIREGFEVTALELADNERKVATSITGLTPIASSFEEFSYPPASVSVVLMSHILEHALDVNLWIQKAHNFLTDDGILAIALPNYGSLFRLVMQEKEPFICPPAHLNFFNPKSLSHLLQKHGFQVEATQWVSRIPAKAFAKRLPSFGKPLLPLLNIASSTALKAIDTLHLGMVINVYGRKVRT